MKKKNIVVLYGGKSTERNISLKTGKMIYENINRKKYNKDIIDTKNDLHKLINLAKDKKIDLAFIALHGRGGEDGTIQGLLEILKVKYTGSGVLASSVGMNKEITQKILNASGVKVPKFTIISRGQKKFKLPKLPFILKPVSHGSSIGVKIIKNKKEFNKSLNEIFKIDNKILIEEYIKGTEITVSVIGRNNTLKALPVVEIVLKDNDFFDYEAKYSGKSEEIVPARISSKTTKEASTIALNVHKIIGCKDMSRTDMIIKNEKIFVLEINTIPGMTKESVLPKAAKVCGIEFNNLIDFFIVTGLRNEK